MRIDELFRTGDVSLAMLYDRIKNSKSDAERSIWTSQLPLYTTKLNEEKLADYFKRLQKQHKIKKLGGGAYSKVFQHPEFRNVVVKVYIAKDTVYKKYLDWVRKHQGNPYVPQVIDEVQFEDGENKYNIVFMQKMRPLNVNTSFLKAIKNATPTVSSTDYFKFVEAWYKSNASSKLALKKIGKLSGDKDLEEVLNFITSFPTKNIDLHSGNVMMRGKQLVFTDPVAFDPTSRVDEL